MYPMLERVVECAFSHDELKIIARWVAEYCKGDAEALDYFKDLCLYQHEQIVKANELLLSALLGPYHQGPMGEA